MGHSTIYVVGQNGVGCNSLIKKILSLSENKEKNTIQISDSKTGVTESVEFRRPSAFELEKSMAVHSINDCIFSDSIGIFVLYSIHDASSFKRACKIINCPAVQQCPLKMFIGTHFDMQDKREIDTGSASEEAKDANAFFLEVSNTTGTNLTLFLKIFKTRLFAIRNRLKMQEAEIPSPEKKIPIDESSEHYAPVSRSHAPHVTISDRPGTLSGDRTHSLPPSLITKPINEEESRYQRPNNTHEYIEAPPPIPPSTEPAVDSHASMMTLLSSYLPPDMHGYHDDRRAESRSTSLTRDGTIHDNRYDDSSVRQMTPAADDFLSPGAPHEDYHKLPYHVDKQQHVPTSSSATLESLDDILSRYRTSDIIVRRADPIGSSSIASSSPDKGSYSSSTHISGHGQPPREQSLDSHERKKREEALRREEEWRRKEREELQRLDDIHSESQSRRKILSTSAPRASESSERSYSSSTIRDRLHPTSVSSGPVHTERRRQEKEEKKRREEEERRREEEERRKYREDSHHRVSSVPEYPPRPDGRSSHPMGVSSDTAHNFSGTTMDFVRNMDRVKSIHPTLSTAQQRNLHEVPIHPEMASFPGPTRDLTLSSIQHPSEIPSTMHPRREEEEDHSLHFDASRYITGEPAGDLVDYFETRNGKKVPVISCDLLSVDTEDVLPEPGIRAILSRKPATSRLEPLEVGEMRTKPLYPLTRKGDLSPLAAGPASMLFGTTKPTGHLGGKPTESGKKSAHSHGSKSPQVRSSYAFGTPFSPKPTHPIRKPELPSSKSTPIILDITLPTGRSAQISAKSDDNAFLLAEEFIESNSLPRAMLKQLTELIQSEISLFLEQEEKEFEERREETLRKNAVGQPPVLGKDRIRRDYHRSKTQHTMPSYTPHGPNISSDTFSPSGLSSTQLEDSVLSPTPINKPLFEIPVDFGYRKKGRICVREGDHPRSLARNFARIFSLRKHETDALVAIIQRELSMFYLQREEGAL
ncbi:Small GTPase like protein [Aduncisulcus paluster]|uniref:Small GTPase like protein n=1 Tax=Aduncisulcus paluster TaxID=2918883 RepID=A0ABQ5KWT1_9EUKA|nr:Small GTPase like protein [Aduncisulcus paluster]